MALGFLGYKLLGHTQCIQVHFRRSNKYPFGIVSLLYARTERRRWLSTENLPVRKFFNLSAQAV
jgi:hypothetical protein